MVGIGFSLPPMRQEAAWLSTLPLSIRARLMVSFAPVMIDTVGLIGLGS